MRGFPKYPLGELCEKITDGTHHSPENLPTGKYKYITAKNIKPWGLDLTDLTFVDESTHREIYARCDVKKDDILFIKDGATTGIAVINPLDEEFSLLSSVGVLRPGPALLPKFLLYALLEPETKRKMLDEIAGVAITRLTLKKIKSAEMPLAPKAEQTRIVTKLEELLSELDAGVAELKAAQKKLNLYRQSLLKAAVEGSSRDDILYPRVPLGSLITEIGQGWSPKCKNEPASDENQWAVIKTTAIQPLCFDGKHNKALPTNLQPRHHLALMPGDLLVTRAGPRSRVGITCLVRHARQNLMLCDKAYRIKCDASKIESSFLELVLNSPDYIQQIDSIKTGINDSGLNLTQDRFFTLLIPVPDIDTQLRIVSEITSLNLAITEQLNAVNYGLKQSAAQRQNILRAAFAGELVPQDPNDEPASALLERIRAERAAVGKTAKPRGRKAKEQK